MANKKTVKALALLLLPLSLAASPDGLGYVVLGGQGLLSGQLLRQSYTASGQAASIEQKQASGSGLQLMAVAAAADWASIVAEVRYDGSTTAYEQLEGPGGALGQLKRQTETKAREFSAGVRLYPASLWATPFVPGLGNPEGPLYWPVLSAAYWRLDSAFAQTVQSSTGSLAGAGGSDATERSQGYRVGVDLPLHPRLSVGLDRVKALETAYASPSLNWSNDGSYEKTTIHLSGFASLRSKDPEWVDDFIPQVGRPGDLRLDLGYGLLLDGHGEPKDLDWAEATYAVNGAVSLGLRYDLRMQRNRPTGSPRQDQRDSELQLNEHRLGLSLGVNFGALPWAGKPSQPAADPLPVQGVQTEAPKQLPNDDVVPAEAPEPEAEPKADERKAE